MSAPPKLNRIKVGLTLYKDIDPMFFQEWLAWQSELARLTREDYAGLMTTYMPYVDHAENTIVDQSLRCTCQHGYSKHMAWGRCNEKCECEKYVAAEQWDYLVMVESDNILPRGWIERIQHYDLPIVSLLYFGKVDIDQRPIPGFVDPRNGTYTRLDYDRVKAWTENPGFYEVDSVGLGATAIRRDVFERWDIWKMPWFQTTQPGPLGILGQDIAFCIEAKRLGHKIYLDTHFTAEHIGPWRSSLANYLASNDYKGRREAEGNPLPDASWYTGPPQKNGRVKDSSDPVLVTRL